MDRFYRLQVQKTVQIPSKIVNINPYKPRKSHLPPSYQSFVSTQTSHPTVSNEHGFYHPRLYQSTNNNQATVYFSFK